MLVRCYRAMTGLMLRADDPRFQSFVSAGGDYQQALATCLQVLDGAALAPQSSANPGMLVTMTPETRAILEFWHGFHRTWFPSDNFSAVLPKAYQAYNDDVFDHSEPALFITRALFQNGIPYSSTVNGNYSLEAQRTEGYGYPHPSSLGTHYTGPFRYSLSSYPVPWYADEIPLELSNFSTLFHFPYTQIPTSGNSRAYQTFLTDTIESLGYPRNELFVQHGELAGIRAIDEAHDKYSFYADVPSNPWGSPNYYTQTPTRIFFHRAFGGGLLGTPAYIMLNLGRNDFQTSDGARIIPRRLAASVFTNLLCKSLPVVRPEDAAPLSYPSSNLPFRANSCVVCHSSIDRQAGGFRNFMLNPITDALNVNDLDVVRQIPVSQPAHPDGSWVVTSPTQDGIGDPLFANRPPAGTLFFRSTEGALITESFDGPASLGTRLSSHRDFYTCAAKRYFQFLTGIDANIDDPALVPPLNDEASFYRNFVLTLGAQLQQHQSLRQLIQTIISQPLFRSDQLRWSPEMGD
jgi:hypothetical protein